MSRAAGRHLAPASALALALLGGCSPEPGAGPPAEPAESQPAAAGARAEAEDPAFARAEALREAGRHAEAAEEYARLAAELARSGDRRREAVARIELAQRQLFLGRHAEAAAALPELRRLAAGEADLESRVAYLAAVVRHREGRLEEAFGEAETALARAREAADTERIAQAYGVLGTVHSLSGRYRESLAMNERRVALGRRHAPGSAELATALNSLGIDYRHFGRYAEAEGVYEEALAIFRARGDPNGVAMILYNLANVLSATGDVERALELKLEALVLAEEVGNTYGLGLLHNDLGEIYRAAGNFAAARRHLDQGLAIHRRAHQAYGEVSALELLGRLELAEGRPAQAREALLESVRLADAGGYGKEQAMARAVLARATATAGSADEALRWADDALVRARHLGDPQVELEALQSRGAALEAAGDPAAAAAEYLEGLDLLESWRGRLALGERRLGLADPWLAVYEGAIRSLLAQHLPGAAFEVAERSRARFLLDLLAQREADPAVSEEERLEQRLRERHGARQRTEGPSRAEIDREIEELTERLDRLVERDRALRPAVGAARHPRPASLAELQQGLLAPGRALAAFFWGDEDVYGWWLDEREVRGARLGAAADLTPRVGFLRSALEDPASEADWRPAAASLYRLLLAPLAPTEGGELLVVADGPLSYLPFEVLLPPGPAPPLGATRVLSYGPSASILLALAQAPPPGPFGRTLLAVGNPAADAGVGAAAPPLPYAEVEARRIARLFRPAGADLLRGDQATLEGWRSLHPERYRYLHFAVHARVGEGVRREPRLDLAGPDLGLAAIRRLRLRAELVTLSGCETAFGERMRGEGVIGLPHAFLAAGARAVAVSLWRVDDRETAELMRRFYRELGAGHSPAEALWRARRDRLARPGGPAHPSRWAPFILMGGVEGR